MELLLSEDVADGLAAPLHAVQSILFGTGGGIAAREVRVALEVGTHSFMVPAHVIPGLPRGACLLGMPLLRKLRATPELALALADIIGHAPGLSITFNAPLNRIDRFIIDGVIVGVLGRGTTCEIAEFVVRDSGETLVRLSADSPDQLLAVALVLTEVVGNAGDEKRREVELWGRRYVADDLRARWMSTVDTLKSMELRIEPAKLEAAVARDPAYRAFEGVTTTLGPNWRETLAPIVNPVSEGLRAAAALDEKGESLQQLLVTLFEPGDMHAWLRTTFGVAVAAAVPGPAATHAGVVAGAIAAWGSRGLLTPALFARLLVLKPEAAGEVRAVAAKWGFVLEGPVG